MLHAADVRRSTGRFVAICLATLALCGAGCSIDRPVDSDAGASPPQGDTDDPGGVDASDDTGEASYDSESPDGGTTLPSECGPPRSPDGSGNWQILCDSAPVGNLLSVWGAGPDDVYMVGGRSSTDPDPGETLVMHWNGTTLETIETPGEERAWWVFGTDRNHVYVVGENGLVLRRTDGGDFERIPTDIDQTIFGAWGASPDRIYLVSGSFRREDARGKVHILTPDGVDAVDAAPLDNFEGKALFKVWGAGPDDIFVAGTGGAIFHWDGEQWSRMQTPGSSAPILTVAGRNGDDVYAVGGTTEGVAWHFDGDSWSDVSPPGSLPRLMGVHAADQSPVLVSGARGYLARLGSDVTEPLAQLTSHPLHAVWQDGRGGAWAVGGNIFTRQETARGAVVRRPPNRNCPDGAIEEPGYHHLDIQGAGGERREDGSFPMYDVERGTIHPELEHGEHYIVGSGSYVEFTVPLCADITDEVAFRITNNDDPNAKALHELYVLRDGREMLVAEAVDEQDGDQGYIPFNRSSLPEHEEEDIAQTDTNPNEEKLGWEDFENAPDFETPPRDILARPGDKLLYRATNLTDEKYGVMAWYPQDGLHYQTFLEVKVPETPGGATGGASNSPPEPGPCASTTEETFVEIGHTDDQGFEPAPPAEIPVEWGPQGSLMLILSIRGDGFTPGDPNDPLAEENPRVILQTALEDWPDEGGRLLFDGDRRRGFSSDGDHHVLSNIRATVNPGDASRDEIVGETVYAKLQVVDATSNETLCQRVEFTATGAE